jgi:hypothetical protein
VRRLEGVERPACSHASALARPRLGVTDVHEWLAGLGIESTAALEVVHERPWSTVIRVPTAEGDLYLKQEEPVQAQEVPLIVALASRWPDRVPEVVAADVERGWLLMRDGGVSLADAGTVEPFPRALELYGELQVGEVAHAEELLALGLPDVRLPVVTAGYEPYFDEDRGLEPDEVARLRALAARYYELSEQLASFGLPDSIQHDDLHEWNVFVRDGRVRIFDWGDTGISNPLFSWLKPLRVTAHRGFDPELFLGAYLSPWTEVMSEERLRAAIEVAIPVGTFAYILQQQRQHDAMPAGAPMHYFEDLPKTLRGFLTRLEAA